VSNQEDIWQEILAEAHQCKFSMHSGETKMYRDIKRQFWWNGMKRDISQFVARCLTCQRVKAEHKRPGGLLQPLHVPQWKWEDITMDFVTGLPRTVGQKYAIWMIIDKLTKSAHFISINEIDPLERLSKIYVEEIVRLHGVPTSIVSDRDPRFTSKFWERMQKQFGNTLRFSTTAHPQTDGQSEKVIQILEDMLRACALDFGNK
jgi:transposase InsO family protein